jgi:transposase
MRVRWASYQPRVDPSRLVFIDETWTKTNMAPLREVGAHLIFLPKYSPDLNPIERTVSRAIAA